MNRVILITILLNLINCSYCNAIEGYKDPLSGRCKAVFWTIGTLTYNGPQAKYGYLYSGPWYAPTVQGPTVYNTFVRTASFYIYEWNNPSSPNNWIQVYGNYNKYTQQSGIDWLNALESVAPHNTPPSIYWPNGPPDVENCSDDPCQDERQQLEEECGEFGINEESWNQETCVGTCNCTQLKAAKEVECGGAEYLTEWNDITCSGRCYCENEDGTPEGPMSVSYMQLVDFCGGVSKVASYDKILCKGACDDCSNEYQALEEICANEGQSIDQATWNEADCTGDCKEDCSVEVEAKETECGLAGVDMKNWNFQTCTGNCLPDCSNQHNELEDKCGIAGIATWDESTCSGTCKDCEGLKKSCEEECGGTVKNHQCIDSKDGSGKIIAVNEGECLCGIPEVIVNIGGDPDVTHLPQPGDAGGQVVRNADGSHTETLPDGTKIHYAAGGGSVTVKRPDGSSYKRELVPLPEGGWTYVDTATDAKGNYRKTTNKETQEGKWEMVEIENGKNTVPSTQNKEVTQVTQNTSTNNQQNDQAQTWPSPSDKSAAGSAAMSNNGLETALQHQPEDVVKNITAEKAINWQPLKQSLEGVKYVFPVSLVTSISDQVSRFSGTPKAPEFEITLAGASTTVSLERFDGLAQIVRLVFGIMLTIGLIWILLKQWRVVK